MKGILLSIILLNKYLHYSTINFLIFLVVLYNKKYLYYPFIITNSIAIFITWNSTIIIWDNFLIQKMLEKNNWSYYKYFVGDIILHFIPFLTSIILMMDKKLYLKLAEYKDHDYIRHCGLFSLFCNILWSILNQGTLNLSNAYVVETYYNWNNIWSSSIITHLVSMYILNNNYDYYLKTI